MNILPEKQCNKCKQIKPLKDFSNGKGSFGVLPRCKECTRIDAKTYRRKYYTSHPLSCNDKKIRSIYKHNHRINNLDEYKSREKLKYQRDRDKILARAKKYRDDNLEKVRLKDKERKKLNPPSREKNIQYLENRRAKKLAVVGKISSREWESLLDFYEHRCLCCGRNDVKLELDHIIPLNPGTHTIDNVQPLCRTCNASKRRKTIDYRNSVKG